MNDVPQNRASRSGGFLLAISIIVGAIAGTILRQPSLGFLAGTAVGIALLVTVYLMDRRR
jgi:hypothetical protein